MKTGRLMNAASWGSVHGPAAHQNEDEVAVGGPREINSLGRVFNSAWFADRVRALKERLGIACG